VDAANKLINDTEPWNLYKQGLQQDLANVMYTVLETLRQVAIALSPITPVLSAEIQNQLGQDTTTSVSWECILHQPLQAGQKTCLTGPLLPRLDSELLGVAKKEAASRTSLKSGANQSTTSSPSL
jgi:methionyl-tRNA synthetase